MIRRLRPAALAFPVVLVGCGEPEVAPCDHATKTFGIPYCLRTVGIVELKLFPPDQPVRNGPIAVFLHGDTANGYFQDWGYEWLLEEANANGWYFVAALAPNRCSWWRTPNECAWELEDHKGRNVAGLAGALDALIAENDLSPEGIRYVGYSGGSTFLTGHWVPLVGHRYPGIVVANCGGEAPIYDFSWNPSRAGRAAIPLVYTWGSRDFMGGAQNSPDYVGQSIDWYTAAGFPVDALEVEGLDHCGADYDWDARTLELWSAFEG